MSKNLLKVLAVINAAFLIIPSLFIPYRGLFSGIIYVFFGWMLNDEDKTFCYGYWAMALILIIIVAKFLYKIFQERKKIYVMILTPCSITLFIIFGVNTFPHYSEFPAKSTQDIINEESLRLANGIAIATNKHPNPPFYYSEKSSIEQAFKKYHDTITDRKYTSEDMRYELFFGIPDENLINIYLDTILYSNDFNKMFVTIIYEAESHKYSGHGFIGYRLPGNDSAIKLFPVEITLFPYIYTKDDLIRSLRTSYFIDRRFSTWDDSGNALTSKYSPLDKEFWNGLLYTKGKTNDSLYPFETDWDFDKKTKTKLNPYLLVHLTH
jgi:hypothetical protein